MPGPSMESADSANDAAVLPRAEAPRPDADLYHAKKRDLPEEVAPLPEGRLKETRLTS